MSLVCALIRNVHVRTNVCTRKVGAIASNKAYPSALRFTLVDERHGDGGNVRFPELGSPIRPTSKNERYGRSNGNGRVAKVVGKTADAVRAQAHQCRTSNHQDDRKEHGDAIRVAVGGLGRRG